MIFDMVKAQNELKKQTILIIMIVMYPETLKGHTYDGLKLDCLFTKKGMTPYRVVYIF